MGSTGAKQFLQNCHAIQFLYKLEGISLLLLQALILCVPHGVHVHAVVRMRPQYAHACCC
eukprot:348750-Pelagomonas_calceolata.AAC.1